MIPVPGPWQMSLSSGARSGLEWSTGGLSLQPRTEMVMHLGKGKKEWQELGQECSGAGRRQSHCRLCWDTGQP